MTKRCIILGSGYSLKGFNFWSLKNEIVFTVNKMAYFAPFAEHKCFWDHKFYYRERKKLNKISGQFHSIVNVTPIRFGVKKDVINDKRVNCWNIYGDGKICRTPGFIGNNNMSIVFALNIGIQLGYNEFYILGADNKFTDDRVHFYDKNPKCKEHHNIYKNAFEVMTEKCNMIKEQLTERVVIVGDSTLDMFENISIDEFKKLINE